MSPPGAPVRTVLLTGLTLLAFAGNSLLCRLALAEPAIDALTFTAIRLGSGALALLPFLELSGAPAEGDRKPAAWSPFAAAMLLGYAVTFSLAYVSLDAGVGALLLFGAVQVTMLGAGWLRGERLAPLQLAGLAAALAGLAILVRPGLAAPDAGGAALMSLAGVAWGLYSLWGRAVSRPAAATARNFLMAAPVALAILPLGVSALGVEPHLELRGALLAVASGALTSGLGYVLWYSALAGHTRTSAAIVQLAVPVLAALGGVALLHEPWTGRFTLSALLTLGGVAAAVLANSRRSG